MTVTSEAPDRVVLRPLDETARTYLVERARKRLIDPAEPPARATRAVVTR
ncbi:hypothetical protein [Cryptosporangium sp. NPDC051539]